MKELNDVYEAAVSGDEEKLKELLRKYNRFSFYNDEGISPIQKLASENNADAVKLLLKFDESDSALDNAITGAAVNNHLDLAREIIADSKFLRDDEPYNHYLKISAKAKEILYATVFLPIINERIKWLRDHPHNSNFIKIYVECNKSTRISYLQELRVHLS